MSTTTPMSGAVAWFEVGTADHEGAERFYGQLFGWTFAPDEGSGLDYTIVTTGEDHPIRGGLWPTKGETPPYAVFCVVVPDVAATCRRAEELGGKVLVGPVPTPGGLVFAHLLDPEGNRIGVYSPPSGAPA